MHLVCFGERHGFSHQASQSAPQGAVEALDVIGVGFGLTLGELVLGDDFGISLPNVSEAVRRFVRCWNGCP